MRDGCLSDLRLPITRPRPSHVGQSPHERLVRGRADASTVARRRTSMGGHAKQHRRPNPSGDRTRQCARGRRRQTSCRQTQRSQMVGSRRTVEARDVATVTDFGQRDRAQRHIIKSAAHPERCAKTRVRMRRGLRGDGDRAERPDPGGVVRGADERLERGERSRAKQPLRGARASGNVRSERDREVQGASADSGSACGGAVRVDCALSCQRRRDGEDVRVAHH